MRNPIKDQVAIVGIGSTGFSRDAGEQIAKSLANTPTDTKRSLLSEVQDAVTASVTAAMTLQLAKKQISG